MRNQFQTIGNIFFLVLALTASRYAIADVIESTISHVSRAGTTFSSVIAPADIAFFNVRQNAAVQVNGGSVSWLELYDNSTASISGGDISWLELYDNSSVRITGVEDLSWLILYSPTSVAEIVANNVQYIDGHLSGIWENGKSFEFWAITDPLLPRNPLMPSNILITSIPEPSTAILLIGGLAFLLVQINKVKINRTRFHSLRHFPTAIRLDITA